MSWLRRKPKPPSRPLVEVPGTGVTDLHRFILAQYAAVPPSLRQSAEWRLSDWWWEQCQRLDRPDTGVPALGCPAGSEDRQGFMLGLPAVTGPDLGWPHLAEKPRKRLSREADTVAGVTAPVPQPQNSFQRWVIFMLTALDAKMGAIMTAR